MAEEPETILEETDDFISVTVGVAEWQTADGRYLIEKDYRVAGEVWQVHKTDADPFPSRPHAHCVGGAQRFIGSKLHLGTAELFYGRKSAGRFLEKKQFNRLIDLIRPKFPGLVLPLR